MGYMLQVVTVGHPGISPSQYSGYNNHQCSWAEMGLVSVPGQFSPSRLLLISEWLTQKGRHMIPPWWDVFACGGRGGKEVGKRW